MRQKGIFHLSRQTTRGQIAQQHPQGKEVGAGIRLGEAKLLWGGKLTGATDGGVRGFPLLVVTGDAKVDEYQRAVLPTDDILGLDVPMNDRGRLAVEVGENVTEGSPNLHHLTAGHRARQFI